MHQRIVNVVQKKLNLKFWCGEMSQDLIKKSKIFAIAHCVRLDRNQKYNFEETPPVTVILERRCKNDR